MLHIGLIKEGKNPPDNRVALSPQQCITVQEKFDVKIIVEPSAHRCFPDDAYKNAGISVDSDLSTCDILLGIKEVPITQLIENKTYLFFSHTKKKQPYNKPLMQAMIQKKIRLIDYECLTYPDNQRVLGFGFFAGVVGAHNGLLTYGKKNKLFELKPAHLADDYEDMLKPYQDIHLPPIKIVLTGGGKVASGMLEIMNRFDIEYVEPQDFLANTYDYPVYTHLKGDSLYVRKDDGTYHRDDFHQNPEAYRCLFPQYLACTDILMNGIYWDKNIPRLFEKEDITRDDFKIRVIADITCDQDGSVPINYGASTIADPVYGIHRTTGEKTAPFLPGDETIDVMAVDNLPNELPRDASIHFGSHLKKFILPELLSSERSEMIERATICEQGKLTPYYEYLSDYAYE